MSRITFFRGRRATHVGEREARGVVPGVQGVAVEAAEPLEKQMNPIEGVKEWLWRVAIGKGLKRGVQALVAWAIAQELNKHGVAIDPDALTVSLLALSETGRNWLKHRFPKALGWI